GGRLSRRATAAVVIAPALAMVAAWPLSFSTDTHSYIGFARLATSYHANPYFAGTEALLAARDPMMVFMTRHASSPYGPLWTWLSIAVVWATGPLGVFVQLTIFKLIAAAALMALARIVGELAEHLEPGRGTAAALAVGINPLLVIEGPGNGHNDVLMMALALGAILALVRRRSRMAALLVGAAAAIKYIPLALVPWMAIACGAGELCAPRNVAPRRTRMTTAVVFVATALVPLVITFAPFWRGLATLAGIGDRWHTGQIALGGPIQIISASSVAAAVVYAATSIWVTARPELVRIVAAWTCVSIVLFFTVTGMFFPWYLAWSWPALFARWNRWSRIAAMLLMTISALWMLAYSRGPTP
ncbi:MAG TPA: hypothetical protein VN903_03750, partial [Polyangia bacterium]|nr:hypothetical protein [Polyangia bacterium]